MRKFGKFEKRPEKPVTKQEKEQNPLLQTYFSSLLSLVLCVTMFLGTSYAWFSSEVQNTGNEIYVGILKVDLEKQTDVNTWVPLSTITTEGENVNKLYDRSIRWEPGYTSLETIRVVDKGDLAFTYTLGFIGDSIANTQDADYYSGKDAEELQEILKDAAKWFDIWVFDHQKGTYVKPESYAAIREEGSGWKHVGTLEEVLNGKAVLSGTMKEAAKARSETLAEEENTHKYTIAMHMNGEMVEAGEEDSLNALMGQKLSLSVKLVASQTSSEADGTGNMYYDQVVTNAEQLAEAFKNGGVIGLAADIDVRDIDSLATVPEDKEVELYMNGHKISAVLNFTEDSATQVFYVSKGGKLTIYGDETSEIYVEAGRSKSKVSAIINNCGGTVVINGGSYRMLNGTYEQDYLIPTLIENNSTLGEATVIINGGTFLHDRNMFRNFANNKTEKASIIINGGTFEAKDDAAAIWNQKTNGDIPNGNGVVQLNGGVFKKMTVCTGFADENSTPVGVILADGIETIALGQWTADGAEWVAEIVYTAPAEETE